MYKQKITFTTLLMALGCLAFLPQMFALSPPPDGCYPNYTTAEGCSALNALTSGAGNTGLGWYALFGTSTGNFNTAVGGGALVLNNGNSNTATGAVALLLNTGGEQNTAVGTNAMVYNDTGNNNTAVGAFALFNNTTSAENSALGVHALFSHQTGNFNNAVGGTALNNDETGAANNAFGAGALGGNISGSNNTAAGHLALANSTGDYNTALGSGAGSHQGIGSNNIYIGDMGLAGDNNVISIGAVAASGMPYTATYIGGIYDGLVTNRIVYVRSDGLLGTLSSSRRYKEEIKPMNKTSEPLYELKPVTFRYKKEIDPSRMLTFGLIAEEVAKVSPDLISCDKEGKPQTVRYEAVNAMLLNEFLKEHKKVQQLEATLVQQQENFETRFAEQEKRIKSLTAGLQKISAQLEATKPEPRVAVDNP